MGKSKYGQMPTLPSYIAKVKGDAGEYRVLAVDYINNKLYLDRVGGEWIPIAKIALELPDEVGECKKLTKAQKEAFWELEALTGLEIVGIGDITSGEATPAVVWERNIQMITDIRADATNILFPE